MQIGLVFPQTEISPDPAVVRDYAQTAERLGFSHLLAYDHVIGADITVRPNWRGPYTLHSQFHEVFVLFGYLAGLTERIGFATGILILPQRQTVLVAKQAAEVQTLSQGRFRLGIGIGWNAVEFQTLGENFHNRGARSEEQIEVLRRLFTEPSVTYHGRWHRIEAAGINPLPAHPIPIWLGGYSERTLRRVVRLADGWICARRPSDETAHLVRALQDDAREAGRDLSSIGIEGIAYVRDGGVKGLRDQVDGWRDLGADYIAIDTMRAGIEGRAQIDLLAAIKDELEPLSAAG